MVSQPELKVIKGALEGGEKEKKKKALSLQTHNCTKITQNANDLDALICLLLLSL